jgi:hypothetical protein
MRLRAARDAFERVEVLLIRIGEGVEMLLCGLDLCVTHAIHDALQIRAASEQPGCVRVTEVVDAHGEVDTTGRDCRKPDVGAEAVAGDRGADLRGEDEVISAELLGADVCGDRVELGLAETEGPWLVVLRVGLHDEAFTGGRVDLGRLDDRLLDAHRASQEVDVAGAQRDQLAPAHAALYEGFQHQPVLRRHCGQSRSNSAGVRVRDLRAITIGSSVWSHGL